MSYSVKSAGPAVQCELVQGAVDLISVRSMDNIKMPFRQVNTFNVVV